MPMTNPTLSADDVASFLQANPTFFEDHAELFSTLSVPHPHGQQAISLGERQILTLRERNRELDWRLSELVHNAGANESIGASLSHWTARLLAESDNARIPGEIALGLAEQFDLSGVALRVWGLPGQDSTGYGEAVSEDVRTFADSLKTPYRGDDCAFEAVSWLVDKPASLALIALRPGADAASIGLLVLGSSNPERFSPDMGSTFLETIGALASAALQRLAAPASA